MDRSSWKICYITGGSSGIGYAIADKLCSAGTRVVLIARRAELLEQASTALRKKNPGAEIEAISADVADRGVIRGVLEQAFADHGVPDLLINCAGVAYPEYFEHLPDEEYDRSMNVNAGGAWNVMKAAVPRMGPGSQIVNVASISGFIGTFGYTAYSAGKFALVGMSEALRNELSLRGIRVSVLCPPDTSTPQLQQEEHTKPPETRAVNGNVRVMQPEEVADELFRRLRKQNFMITPGRNARIVWYAKRFFPGLVFRIADRAARKAAGDAAVLDAGRQRNRSEGQ
jgi:short-subunit dehydrogenase